MCTGMHAMGDSYQLSACFKKSSVPHLQVDFVSDTSSEADSDTDCFKDVQEQGAPFQHDKVEHPLPA